jgi:GrpB-like predicted nucleotidyltransferase (UPF0157 family)
MEIEDVKSEYVAKKHLLHESERSFDIFEYRHGIGGNEPHTFEATGKKFGVTRERIRQITAKIEYRMGKLPSDIGLKRGVAKLRAYSSSWPAYFEDERYRLWQIFGNKILGFEHIGSTSVPGLTAKPIIDMLMAIKSLNEIKQMKPILEKMGYQYRPNAGNAERVMFAKGPEENRTHDLHITTLNSQSWRQDLAFRDLLRNHPEVCREYERLKLSLAKQYEDTRELYTEGKAKFIKSTLTKI